MISIDNDTIVIGEKKTFIVTLTDDNNDPIPLQGTIPKVVISDNKRFRRIEKDGTIKDPANFPGQFEFTLSNSDAPLMKQGKNYLRVFTQFEGDKTNRGEVHIWFTTGPNAS